MVIQGSAEPVRRGKEGRITQPSNVVRRPPTRFPSNPLKIRVTFVPTIQFYQKDPRNKKGKRILLGPMASLTSVEAGVQANEVILCEAAVVVRTSGLPRTTIAVTLFAGALIISRLRWYEVVCASSSWILTGKLPSNNKPMLENIRSTDCPQACRCQ